MKKETQADFGLTTIETSENEARPLYGVKVRTCLCDAGTCVNKLMGHNALVEGYVCKSKLTSAPTPTQRALPTDGAARKRIPMYSGLIVYFPDALAAVARRSWMGNEQHHPGTPVHWDKTKSTDHADCIVRHLTDYADSGETEIEELEAAAWRSLALLQTAYDKRKAAK